MIHMFLRMENEVPQIDKEVLMDEEQIVYDEKGLYKDYEEINDIVTDYFTCKYLIQ